jgi:hypothetical protein
LELVEKYIFFQFAHFVFVESYWGLKEPQALEVTCGWWRSQGTKLACVQEFNVKSIRDTGFLVPSQ